MAIIGSYSLSQVNLQVECEDSQLAKRVIGAFDDCFFGIWGSYQEGGVLGNHMTKGSLAPKSHDITLRLKNNDFSIKAPEIGHELYASSSVRVLKEGDFYYLIRGDSLFQLDLRNSLGIGLLDSTFWKRSLKSKEELLMFSLLWLLRQHGLYALHGNGLVKDEVGVLLIGGSGSGKSTTALSLIRQGWGFLSDDVILVRHGLDGIEAIAFQKGFSFDLNLANRYPELNRPLESVSLNGQKRFLDINSIYPDRFLPGCFPKVLIFPKIASQDKTQLIPIDRSKALIQLIENSGGMIMVDKEIVVKQLEVFKQLVYQTSNYQLLAGRDLYEEPERISEILNIFSH